MEYSDSINWRRGFNRLFAVAWAAWALWIFVGVPVMTMNSRQQFAAYMDVESMKLYIRTDEFRSYIAGQSKERWDRATIKSAYEDEILAKPYLPILLTIVPPLAIYLALYFAAKIVLWIRGGFAGWK